MEYKNKYQHLQANNQKQVQLSPEDVLERRESYARSRERVDAQIQGDVKFLSSLFRKADNATLLDTLNSGVEIGIGSSGEWVYWIQVALTRLGYGSYLKHGADFKYGADTKKAIEAFQRTHNLPVDGVVGSATLQKLDEMMSRGESNQRKKTEKRKANNEKDKQAIVDDENFAPRYTGKLRTSSGTSLSGWGKFTPEVSLSILENLSLGKPAFRPDLGLGGCSWFVTEGNPYVGISPDKTIQIDIKVQLPKNALKFTTTDLVQIHNEIASNISESFVETEWRQKSGFEGELTGKKLRNVRQGGRFFNKVVESKMWKEVAKRIKNSSSKAGEVILDGTTYSKQGPGRYGVFADPSIIKVEGGIEGLVTKLESQGLTAEPVVQEASEALMKKQRQAGRVRAVFKYGGRILIVYAIAADVYKIYHAENKEKAVITSAGGWVGASAASIAFAAWFTPADVAGPVAWAIHGVGTLVAGGIGYWFGSSATRYIYELVLVD